MSEKQLIMEEIYLSLLGIDRVEWNIARNLMCQEPNGEKPSEFTLEKVVSNIRLRETVLYEVETAKRMYAMAIADCRKKGNSKLLETLENEYKQLCSEPRTK